VKQSARSSKPSTTKKRKRIVVNKNLWCRSFSTPCRVPQPRKKRNDCSSRPSKWARRTASQNRHRLKRGCGTMRDIKRSVWYASKTLRELRGSKCSRAVDISFIVSVWITGCKMIRDALLARWRLTLCRYYEGKIHRDIIWIIRID
jgi:hypothetical protein